MAGLYIHIPFCGRRCAYCDFYSTTSADRAASFLEALKREMTSRRDFMSGGRNADGVSFPPPKLDTIYIGGGTPSVLSPERLQELWDHAALLWDCSGVREVTVEANPEDLTDEWLTRLRVAKSAAPVAADRLSVGIQSFDDDLLRYMNRRHDAARAKAAVRAARNAGFDNISIDLIYGIPGMTTAQWEHSLDEAIALKVQHISAYHLTVEPDTPFGRQGLRPIPEAQSERQFEILRRRLGDAGFEHYEISNFARPGRRAMHNSAYWSGAPYLGIGPSAHSFDGARRREWSASDLDKYIDGAGTPEIYEGETLSDLDLRNERIMTGLRTAEGIDVKDLKIWKFGNLEMNDAENNSRIKIIDKFLREGLLVKNGSRIAIPPEKFLLSDYIIGNLFEPQESVGN